MASKRTWLVLGAALAAGAAYAKRKRDEAAGPWGPSDEGRVETETAQPFSSEQLAEPVATAAARVNGDGDDGA